ncbi:MAG: valine--tRNA ligase [Candidatus Bathyarchaeota archaeon]|nr:valine--tRNA ligase [Candidatus Bathyarchaeum tardum]
MKKFPKKFNLLAIEEKWQQNWEEMGIYHFNREDSRPSFTVDTPPPYPSGNFHMGNVLNWTYIDTLARYKRMRGYNVLFPQGWDCHGLPTEVKTEEIHKIKKTDLPPAEFVKLCKKVIDKYIVIMKKAIMRLGCSVDWTTEYKTMDPDYWRRTQLSFIVLHKKGLIYKGTHPISWCTSCETAIADAEVEHEQKTGILHFIKFKLTDGNHLIIATSRPELLQACVTVAVNPDDERYSKYIGQNITVPVANRQVKIIAQKEVDPKFGTGVLMICTYGDKADVQAVSALKLEPIILIDDKGKMNKNAGKYCGLTTIEARKAIVKDLEASGNLEKIQPLNQEVGTCWRCKHSIEILEHEQWFMNTRKFTEQVKQNTLEVTWYPDYMKKRMIDWTNSLDWDWVISRQRIFATPIPVWYCKQCQEIILAEPDWLPIDPRNEEPKTDRCPKCGGTEFVPETDVLDTWFDSSLTCAVHAGWPDKEDWQNLFPADVHPSGYDIIRTWAYYLMVRGLALFDQKPYNSVLINGMVLGTDGRKMSKSLGNFVATPEVFEKYGADAPRQWATSGGATGSDIPFRWEDVEYAWRFLRKLWNASKFAGMHLKDYDPDSKQPQLELIDRWLLSKMEQVTKKVTEALDNCQFNVATDEIRKFTWHSFCDNYIEAVKHRLYQPETYGEEKRRAAQYTLYTAIYRIIQMLSPISPHITEELYQIIFADDKKLESIHVSSWPEIQEGLIDEDNEKSGDLIVAVMGELRRDKAENQKPLNAEIQKLTVYTEDKQAADVLAKAEEDLAGTCKIQKLEIKSIKGQGKEVQGYPKIQFVAEY